MRKKIVLGSLICALAGNASALNTSVERDKQILWPEAKIPYFVVDNSDSDSYPMEWLEAGIDAWNNAAPTSDIIQFFEIDPAAKDAYSNYMKVELRDPIDIPILGISTECGASAEKFRPDGGETLVVLRSGCGSRAAMHEFGHVLGFLHEHQRKDANLEFNLCNHIKAKENDCRNTSTLGWLQSVGAKSSFYLSEYDPFSIMHYGLQNNVKEDLKDQINPETGYYYTTIDFSRDPEKKNNLVELTEQFSMTEQEFYDQMFNRGLALSEMDKEAVATLYARGYSDVHTVLEKDCFTREAKDNSETGCSVPGEFRITSATSNFGAWPAEQVNLSVKIHTNVDQSSFNWDSDKNCRYNAQSSELSCQLGTLQPNETVEVGLEGILADLEEKTPFSSAVSTTTPQNPGLLDDDQFTDKMSVGGCGCNGCPKGQEATIDPVLPALAFIGFGGVLRRRKQ